MIRNAKLIALLNVICSLTSLPLMMARGIQKWSNLVHRFRRLQWICSGNCEICRV